MRIIGKIDHPIYKISVLKMNTKITLQIEDRLLEQSFVFRDGSGISGVDDIKKILTEDFLKKVDERFSDMNKDYLNAIERLTPINQEFFKII